MLKQQMRASAYHLKPAEVKKIVIASLARYALLKYDRNPDERMVVLVKIIKEHIRKRFLNGAELEDSNDEKPQKSILGN